MEKEYRYYVTDSLWGFARNKGFETRFRDMIDPQPEDTRTAEEIIARIKAGLEVREP